MRTAIVASRVFDGTTTSARRRWSSDGLIESIGVTRPQGAQIVEARATLLPGLIDAHVHTDPAGLRMALQFGVTTELEMQGANTARDRGHIARGRHAWPTCVPPGSASPLPVGTPGTVPQGLQPAARRRPGGPGRPGGATGRPDRAGKGHHAGGGGRRRRSAGSGRIGLHQVHGRRRQRSKVTPACPCSIRRP